MKIHINILMFWNRWIGAYVTIQVMAELKLKIILQQERT